MTIGVMRAFANLGGRCPEKASFIGIDDFDWADIMHPRPRLIAQPIEDMARTAIATLLEQVAGGTRPSNRQLLFSPRLVERESCAPPSGWGRSIPCSLFRPFAVGGTRSQEDRAPAAGEAEARAVHPRLTIA
ncbi:MAG: LacI family DNA-binding transcriptional regulator [Hyphomicrobiales bacterium]|nr:LacI family DNA-binding transcriptional regulator [Hyphomicrobiales bacterium]